MRHGHGHGHGQQRPRLQRLGVALAATLISLGLSSATTARPQHGGLELPHTPTPTAELRERATALTDTQIGLEVGPREGSLTGRVVDARGRPIPGARIRALPVPSEAWHRAHEAALMGDPETWLLRSLALHRWTQALRTEAATDTSGQFTLDNLADVRYRLTAGKTGWRFRESGDEALTRPGDEPTITGTREVEVRVRVLLPDGEEAPDATLVLREHRPHDEEGAEERRPWSPGSPVLIVAADRWTLTAERGARLRSRPLEVEVTPATAGEPLELELLPRLAIRGRVVYPEPEPATSVDLVLAPLLPGDPVATEWLERAGERRSEKLGTDGAFVLGDLAPGDYLLGARRSAADPGGTPTWVIAVAELEERDVEVTLTLPDLPPDAAITVDVRGPDGARVGGDVPVFAAYESGGRTGQRALPQVRTPDGRRRVRLPEDVRRVVTGERPGTAWLEVSSKAFGSARVRLVRGLDSVVIGLEAPAALDVLVRGFRPNVHAQELMLTLERDGPLQLDAKHPEQARPSSKLDDLGRVRFQGVQPGHWELVIRFDSKGDVGAPVARHALVLVPGRNSVEVPAPVDHELVVQLAEPAGRRVWVEAVQRDAFFGGISLYGVTDTSGRVRFGPLAPGRYRVRHGAGPRAPFMLIEIPLDTFVSFRPDAPNALLVTIRDTEGALAAAGLADGDVIEAIAGTLFQNEHELDRLWAQGITAGELSMTVVRGRRRLEVRVPAAVLRADGDPGGRLLPIRR
jgi:protocatechuate 3,4-dioxygenase beta subunit